MGCSDPLRQDQEKWPGSQKSPWVTLVSLSLVLAGAGRFEASVIEERRKGAEDLLRFTVHIPALNNSPQLKEFFRVCAPALPQSSAPGEPTCPQAVPCDYPGWSFSRAGWGDDTALRGVQRPAHPAPPPLPPMIQKIFRGLHLPAVA